MSDADGQEDHVRQAGEDDRASILGVAKQRLPGYLFVFTIAAIVLLVVAIVRSWDSIGEIFGYYPDLLNKYMPAVVTLLIAVEGGIMGGTALLLKLNRERAVEEGRKKGRLEGRAEAIRETIQFLEESGKADVAQLLRREQSNGRGGDQR